MNKLRNFDIADEEQAREALEYFNGFHDGFMKRFVLLSQDSIDEEFGQSCTGLFEVDIGFSHYNYPPGSQRPFHQLVHAKFYNVQEVFMDCREGYLGNTIINLSIHAVNRRVGGTTSVESALALRLGRTFYLQEFRRDEYRESQLFTFSHARITERSTDF